MDATGEQRGSERSDVAKVETSAKGHRGWETTEYSSTADSNDRESTASTEQNINVVHHRRRVNPESLALRLGRELVRDLDALITPGNTEMPSFAARKELQERYNIDRRHIYDYFHSRGLRVVKEDKCGHSDLLRDAAPLPLKIRLRQAPSRSHPPSSKTTEAKSNITKRRGITKAKPGRPKKHHLANPKVASNSVCETNHTTAPVSDDSPPSPVPSPAYVTINPLLPHASLPAIMGDEELRPTFHWTNPPDESLSVTPAIGDITSRHKHVFDSMSELNDYSPDVANDRSLSRNETSPCSSSNLGLLLPHPKPLSGSERGAIYQTLSESLGPANGIQESQGTYSKHMEDRARVYYEGLLSVPYHHSQRSDRPSTSLKRAFGTDEFRSWLSETTFLKYDGINSSQRDLRSATVPNVIRQHTAACRDRRNGHGRRWEQTLDDLFPTELQDLTSRESPVIHTNTEDLPYRAPHSVTQLEADFSQRDDVPFAAISNISVPPVADHSQFHGLVGFPRTQGVSLPAVEIGHPQRSELHLRHPRRSVVLSPGSTGFPTLKDSAPDETQKGQNNTRVAPCSPYKPQLRDRSRIGAKSIASCGARRRIPSVAGGI
ncbi:hypothetical protein BU15DRAFT_70806 [Melanogaster broomeanus]|nr:hypothetical protein BU15DRAFT_70806 [Melanogaster broomeanus]